MIIFACFEQFMVFLVTYIVLLVIFDQFVIFIILVNSDTKKKSVIVTLEIHYLAILVIFGHFVYFHQMPAGLF